MVTVGLAGFGSQEKSREKERRFPFWEERIHHGGTENTEEYKIIETSPGATVGVTHISQTFCAGFHPRLEALRSSAAVVGARLRVDRGRASDGGKEHQTDKGQVSPAEAGSGPITGSFPRAYAHG